ncbi:MAG: Co2+/Mg2+ efflux protein ApaG [Burkholderiales bacterium]|nr:Co2+/Mg2+ efflux protein ApaG [Bacteroidia bacterium]
MNSIITHGIEISVKTRYYAPQSDPKNNHYFFVYEITITNKSEYTVKLLKRHWDITDAFGEKRDVEGEGVVGETPTMEPGESFSYNSGCDFTTDIGKMSGYYLMKKLVDQTEFNVLIPEFLMTLPARLN